MSEIIHDRNDSRDLRFRNPDLFERCEHCDGRGHHKGKDCDECSGQGFILFPLGEKIVELIRHAFPEAKFVNEVPANKRRQVVVDDDDEDG